MAIAPKRPCAYAGCRALVDTGYCADHQNKARVADRYRGNASDRGYDSRWSKARLTFLDSNPLCVHHLEDGFLVAATVVDHIVPHKGNQRLFWDKANWQPLCISCHNKKTSSQDKGAWSPSLPNG